MSVDVVSRPAVRLAGLPGEPLLEVSDLVVTGIKEGREVPLLRGVDLVVPAGARVGIVGESGSGKSMTANALLGLLPQRVRVTGGAVRFRGRNLLELGERELRDVRGGEISIVYQGAVG